MATRVPDPVAFELIQRGVSRIMQVSDDAVADAIRAYWTDTHNLAEGAGAAPLAAAIGERDRNRGRRVALILSGGNIDLALFADWVLGAAGDGAQAEQSSGYAARKAGANA
jgi:threonine dehydratase